MNEKPIFKETDDDVLQQQNDITAVSKFKLSGRKFNILQKIFVVLLLLLLLCFTSPFHNLIVYFSNFFYAYDSFKLPQNTYAIYAEYDHFVCVTPDTFYCTESKDFYKSQNVKWDFVQPIDFKVNKILYFSQDDTILVTDTDNNLRCYYYKANVLSEVIEEGVSHISWDFDTYNGKIYTWIIKYDKNSQKSQLNLWEGEYIPEPDEPEYKPLTRQLLYYEKLRERIRNLGEPQIILEDIKDYTDNFWTAVFLTNSGEVYEYMHHNDLYEQKVPHSNMLRKVEGISDITDIYYIIYSDYYSYFPHAEGVAVGDKYYKWDINTYNPESSDPKENRTFKRWGLKVLSAEALLTIPLSQSARTVWFII
jgi:hypothetical protein